MGILERIKEIEQEMDKTQRNKATEGHLGMLKARLAKLRSELLTPSSGGGGGQVISRSCVHSIPSKFWEVAAASVCAVVWISECGLFALLSHRSRGNLCRAAVRRAKETRGERVHNSRNPQRAKHRESVHS